MTSITTIPANEEQTNKYKDFLNTYYGTPAGSAFAGILSGLGVSVVHNTVTSGVFGGVATAVAALATFSTLFQRDLPLSSYSEEELSSFSLNKKLVYNIPKEQIDSIHNKRILSCLIGLGTFTLTNIILEKQHFIAGASMAVASVASALLTRSNPIHSVVGSLLGNLSAAAIGIGLPMARYIVSSYFRS